MAAEEAKMTISEHLEELRTRLLRSFLASLVGFVIAFTFIDEVFWFIRQPYDRAVAALNADPSTMKLIQSAPFEGFFTSMKLAFLAGMIFAAPVIVSNIWGFVAAGLYRHERSTVKYYAIPGLALFFAGAGLAYQFVMPFALEFLMGWSQDRLGADSYIGIDKYISMIAWAMFVFGLMFQLPLVMVFLMRLGVVTADTFRKYRRHAIVAGFAIAMVLTPPDVLSQVALASCMALLYEIAILIGERVSRERTVDAPSGDGPPTGGSDGDKNVTDAKFEELDASDDAQGNDADQRGEGESK